MKEHWNSLNRIRWLTNERTEKHNNRCISQWQRRNRNLTVFLSFLSCLVCLERVIEVRCGQQTKNFVKFPYTEVESQSFSLMFEKQQGLYAMLLTLYSLSHLEHIVITLWKCEVFLWIFPTKKSSKDLLIEGITLWPPFI